MPAATLSLVVLALVVVSSAAQTRGGKTFDIYVVDVEGGNATLFVSASGESLLMDTGNGGAAAVRDADRIMAAVKDAGLIEIDHRSEERRVGKECRSRWSPDHEKKKEMV